MSPDIKNVKKETLVIVCIFKQEAF